MITAARQSQRLPPIIGARGIRWLCIQHAWHLQLQAIDGKAINSSGLRQKVVRNFLDFVGGEAKFLKISRLVGFVIQQKEKRSHCD
jgi:hypothetical protein